MLLISTFLMSTLSFAGPVRPAHHAYQVPWWERPATPIPPPEASTPPSTRPYSLGEFDPVEGILFTTWYTSGDMWSSDLNDTYVTMFRELLNRDIPVYLCDAPINRTPVENVLLEAGIDTDAIEWMDCQIDSIWMRDFGPFFAMDADENLMIGDAAYYPDRPNDDEFPSDASEVWGEELYEVPLDMEGGNFYSNGDGLCVTTDIIYRWTSASAESAAEAFTETLGCDETLWLEPLYDEGTGHVDMYFTFIDRTNVIVGDYATSADSVNAAILDESADALEAAGMTVHRVPMLPNDDANGDGWKDFFTVINGFFLNREDGTKTFYMPTYYDRYPDETATALIAMEAAMPGVEIIEIPADDLILLAGAIHCVMKTIPVAAWPSPCDDSYDFNDDDPRCDEDEDDDTGIENNDDPEGDGLGDETSGDETDEYAKGCSCATATASPWGLSLLFLVGLIRRRSNRA
jgi:MYXO-CTERM domain-containing protein